jgi:hypothetical protein
MDLKRPDPGDWAESSWLRAACAEARVLLMSLRPWRSIYPRHVSGSVLPGLACQPALRWQSPVQLEMAVAIFSPFSSPLAYSFSLAYSQSTLLPFLITLLSTA